MVQVYIASVLRHAKTLRGVRSSWKDEGIEINSSWIDIVETIPDDETNAKVFWARDLADVMRSDFVLVYAEEGDHLRGALIEVGMAMAKQSAVIIVGDRPDYGTWQYASGVFKAVDFRHAKWVIKHMSGT